MQKYLITAGLLVLILSARWANAVEHPVPLEKDADCATCHEDKTKGKAVHSAIAMGCTTCHEVKTEKDVTTVELTAPKNQICFTCHDVSKDKVKHGPYWQGNCVFCHDPHTSDQPKQLRANVNDLCISCHYGLPSQKVDKEARTITFPFGRTVSFDQVRATPQVGLDENGTTGHPMLSHPFSGPNKYGKAGDNQLTCLSCHQAHSSETANLMPPDVKRDIDVCAKCHR